MEKVKTQKGITLIALIITIIVMLILVGVSVSVALNGGLFTTAKEATEETQIEADREQLLSSVVGAMDKNRAVDKTKLVNDLGTEWTVEGEEGGPYTVTSPKENTFTVDEKGNITEGKMVTITITIEPVAGGSVETREFTVPEGLTWREWIDNPNYDSGTYYYFESDLEGYGLIDVVNPGEGYYNLMIDGEWSPVFADSPMSAHDSYYSGS